MFYVYILQSREDAGLYIGSTNNLLERLKQHNSGNVPSTKSRMPLELIYYEAYRAENDARHREHSLKLRGKALGQLKNRIKNCVVEAEKV